jgi:hypothetical protein
LRHFVWRKELYRRGADPGASKCERLYLPPRVPYDSDPGNLATVREQKVEIIPIGAAFPALKIFADDEKARLCTGVDFAG